MAETKNKPDLDKPITSISGFVAWVNKINNNENSDEISNSEINKKDRMLYRGLTKPKREVSSSLYRRLDKSGMKKNISSVFINAAKQLIEKARIEGHHQKDGDKMGALQLLAELQHMGAATCLIDFSSNPLVALWFACQSPKDEKDGNGKVIMLDTKSVDKYQKVSSDSLEKSIEDFLGKDELWKWTPQKRNNRIVAQQSVFIFGRGIIKKDEIDEFCYIDKDAKKRILKELENQGVSGNSLFCDFTGFARENASNKLYQDWTAEDYFFLGVHAHQSDDFEKAIEHYDKAIELKLKYENLYYNRGIIKLRNNDNKGAIVDFDKAIEINPQYALAYYNRGRAKSAENDIDGAIADFNKAIEIDPKDAWAYHSRGRAKSTKNDIDGAIADFDEVIEIDPQFVWAYYGRGEAKVEKKDIDGAIADFDKAIEIDPQFIWAYYSRSEVKMKKKDIDGAIADFDKMIEINPRLVITYYNRGKAKVEKKDIDGAIADFDKAIEIDPQFVWAYYGRGEAKVEKKNIDGAITDFDKAIEIDPQFASAHYYRGFAKYRLKDYEKADKDYRKAKELAPNESSFIPYSSSR